MALLLLSAFGLALVLLTSAEMLTAANYRDSQEALHAADAALERALGELLTMSDWNEVLCGVTRSPSADGPPGGERSLPAGGTINLTEIVNGVNCGKAGPCSVSEMSLATAERPWGVNNPRYQLFAYGPLADLLNRGEATERSYVVVMVADDPMENDGDPTRDGVGDGNPGRGHLLVRAEAFGPGAAHKVIEATILRPASSATDVGYTGQRGAGESNRAAGAPIPVPVSASTRSTIPIERGGR
jgi:Tfp pilus assembly protein PilX